MDNERVTEDYHNDILTLELPKLQKQESKVTRVQIGSNHMQEISQSESFSEESDSSAINSNLRNEPSSPEGDSEVSAKEMLDTHGSSEPSAENVSSSDRAGGYGGQDVWGESSQTEEQTANQ